MKPPFDEAEQPPQHYFEYLIELGLKGNHILFDIEDIKHAMGKDVKDLTSIDPRKVKEVNKAIQDIIAIAGFEEKKDFIKDLPKDVQDVLIHLYFQMIDRTMQMSNSTLH